MRRNDVERSWRAPHALVQQIMMARTLRLFIAITLPVPLRQALSDTQARLRRELQGVTVGWSRIEGVHLTLKFLGDIDESRVDAIGRCITDVARTWSPVHLELRAIGVFPNAARPKVLWCGVQGELTRLSRMQSELEERLESIGCAREARPFTPHLTLGRFRGEPAAGSVARIKRLLRQQTGLAVGHVTADALSLMKSERCPDGSVYTSLMTATFS